MDELLAGFLDYCREHRAISPHTVASYRQSMLSLIAFLCGKYGTVTPETLTADMFLEYDADCKQRGIRQRTRYVRNAAHRIFCVYLMSKGLIGVNLAQCVKVRISEQAKQPCAAPEDVQKILDATDRLPNRLRGQMLKAALVTLAMTGLRKGELLALTVGDIDIKNKRLCVQSGKGGKQGFVSLNQTVCTALALWLTQRPVTDLPNLFCFDACKPLTENIFEAGLLKLAKLAGVTGITFHAFRRGLATELSRQSGVGIRDIQAILRHSHMSTTWLYLSTNTEHIAEVMEKITLDVPAKPTQQQEPVKPVVKRVEDNRSRPPANRRKGSAWRRP